MPQSERSQIVKELLIWIAAKTKLSGGAHRSEIIRHAELEITALGAAEKTCARYLLSLCRHNLVALRKNKYVITQTGKNWLEKKVS